MQISGHYEKLQIIGGKMPIYYMEHVRSIPSKIKESQLRNHAQRRLQCYLNHRTLGLIICACIIYAVHCQLSRFSE